MSNSRKTPVNVHTAGRICIGIILVSVFPAFTRAETPPPGLAKRVAERASQAREAMGRYMYRQTVVVEEVLPNGARAGEYRETREVVFSPDGQRSERMVGKPLETLKRLKLTEEDFRDIREVQPFLFDRDQLWAYQTKFKGEETIDGIECWVLEVRPRQILDGQRLFDGMVWVNKKDDSIVRTNGIAVPQIHSLAKEENLFPRFTTFWAPVDNGLAFPIHTHADDVLDFRVGPQRIRLTIRYSDYKRFSAEVKISAADEH